MEFAGACYHVINRGNYRKNLFTGEGAAEAFLRVLDEAAERFGWRVHAYVVMSNHFHLAVELGEPNLSEGMKWLQGTWIRRSNAHRRLIGRPFQGRYKALLVAPGHALAQVCHYIHLNPVRARLCPPAKVVGYRWSSLPRMMAKGRPRWLVPATVLHRAGELPDTPKGWKRYLAYLEFLGADEAAQRELCARNMSRGWCVGDEAFREDMRRQMEQQADGGERFGGLEPEAVRELREARWEERLQALARAARIDLQKLPPAKSHPDKALLAAAMKTGSSVANAWLARRLAMGQPASASQFARRWLLTKSGQRAVVELLSRIKG